MCPLVSAPNRGYADYQRIENWDSGIIYQQLGTLISGTNVSAIIDVSRFAYLAGRMSTGTSFGLIGLTWFIDAAGTTVVGQRQFTLDNSIPTPMQMRIPNMGPFVQITADLLGNRGNYNLFAAIFATNRYHPDEQIPFNPYVMNQTTVVGASGVVNFEPNSYFSGPILVAGSFDVGNYTISVQALTPSNVVITYYNSAVFTTTPFSFDVIAPSGQWWLHSFNSAAQAGNLTLTVTPAMTGAT